MTPLPTRMNSSPTIFDPFFEGGQEEAFSPFLTTSSKKLATNLPLKAAGIAALLLTTAFFLHMRGGHVALVHLLLLFTYFFAGIPALIESIQDLVNLQINIDVLMTLAAFGSVAIGSPMEGALLLVLFALSGAMEDLVENRAKAAIRHLHRLSPTRATLLTPEGFTLEKAVNEVSVGDKIVLKAGQIAPLDGKVIEGVSSVNLVHLTGESVPVTKEVGDSVAAGALNLEGALVLQVTHTSADSTLMRIIQLVTQAQESKPQLQRWFDRLSQGYATTIILFSTAVAAFLPFIFSMPFLGAEGSLYRALAFLIAASPCALILAIPIAYLSAIGACARQGIILKGGVVLDALAQCHAIALDKTGTLTTGELVCLGMNPFDKEALSIALALEQKAVHPIAKALTLWAQEQQIRPHPIHHFCVVPGYGVEAQADLGGKTVKVALGQSSWILEKAAVSNTWENRLTDMRERGELTALLLIDNTIYVFSFQDAVRPHIQETLVRLKQTGVTLLMLTGDHRSSAERIASQVGIDEVYADLKPEDKLYWVDKKAKENGLAMVGDGINDAPALARATVGISMGKVGSSAAIEAADVVLLQDNIEKLDWLWRKAYATQWVVKENLILASVAIMVASIPALAGWVPLWLAVLLHEGGTVLVGLNGLRLLRGT